MPWPPLLLFRVAREEIKMKRIVFVLVLAVSCVSANPEAQKVRITNNPDVVRGCEFLGNVLRCCAEETLKLRTYKLGGNVVYIVGKAVYIHGVGNPGLNGTGEAYRCR